MANYATIPSLSTPHVIKNLHYFIVTTVFCTFFYLLSLWLQSPPIRYRSASSGVPVPFCIDHNSTNSISPAPLNVSLDFSSRHYLPHPHPTAARLFRFPPCDASFSEYTPCQDVQRSLKFDRNRLIYRERHCPGKEELLKCRIPAPFGYRIPFRWPASRELVWYANVPHKELTIEKAKQNWVRFEKDRFRFPGGGTMFPRGAGAYIDDIRKLINLKDGSIRTAIDTGCGVRHSYPFLDSNLDSLIAFVFRYVTHLLFNFFVNRPVFFLVEPDGSPLPVLNAVG